MRPKQPTILAVDPGTKEIGVAVLSKGELIYYGVKTLRKRSSPGEILSQAKQVISRLVTDFEPEYLAIEKTFLVQKSASLLVVTAEEIKAAARALGLVVYEYAPTLVRKLICQTGKGTKAEVARVVSARFPELRRYLEGRSQWETLYYANMFDAIALGMCCHQEISKADTLG